MSERKSKQDEREFWRRAQEARREVESWPRWKQAAAGGVLEDPPKKRAT